MDSWNHFTAHILAESSQAPLERRVIESPSGAVLSVHQSNLFKKTRVLTGSCGSFFPMVAIKIEKLLTLGYTTSGDPWINLQLRNKKMLRNESCDPLKIDAACNSQTVARKPFNHTSF